LGLDKAKLWIGRRPESAVRKDGGGGGEPSSLRRRARALEERPSVNRGENSTPSTAHRPMKGGVCE
jgi:hypothetical protein